MMHYGERQRGMRVEGITSLTSGLQIKPVSRAHSSPNPSTASLDFMPPATGPLRTNQFFWRCRIDEGHKNNVVFSRSQKHPCPFPLAGNPLAPISPRRRHAVELHRQAGGKAGRTQGDNASILSEELRYSFPSKQQGQTTDASHSLADEEGGKKIRSEAQQKMEKKYQSFSVYFELRWCAPNQHKVVKLSWT